MNTESMLPRAMQILEELRSRDSWSRELLLEHQRLALRDIVRHAVGSSPHYRETLGPDAAREEIRLEELPTLSKATLMEEWDRIVTDPRLERPAAERYLAGDTAADLVLGEVHILATGGSTGRRGVFVYGEDEFVFALAGMLRALVTVGVSPAMRLASIGSPSPAHLTKHVFELFRTVRPGSPELTVTMPIGELVRALNAYRPEAIATYPTILHLLAEEQLEGRLHIEPRALATSSEVLTEEIRRRARAAWGVTPRNAYASTEGGMMASECPAGCGLHVWEDTVILEVVDDRDRPVSPGSPGSKVLLTNLWNRTQPLIRYELADAVTLAEGANPTGRPFARIADVGGRSADILRLPARDGGEVALHPIHLRAPFTRISEVQQYQFSLAPGALRVRLVLVPDAPRDVPERVQAELAGALERAGAAPIAIEARPVDAIPRVGAGAKLTLLDQGAPPAEPLLARGSSPGSGDRRAAGVS